MFIIYIIFSAPHLYRKLTNLLNMGAKQARKVNGLPDSNTLTLISISRKGI